MDQRVQVVAQIIEKEFSRTNWTTSSLAESVNLSPSRLQHLFKVETGQTPMHSLKCRRLREVEVLLKTGFLSGKEVMNRVGLTNYSNFIHDFKKEFGIAPGGYRRLIKL
jgi:AraC family transcriptional regulator of arabinose operon